MTAYLQNLKVKKVSLVRRGANRKEFFLAKSADFAEGKDSNTNTNTNSINNNNDSGGTTVRKEIKDKLTVILKENRDVVKIVDLLKADTVLKITEDEITLVKDFISMLPEPPKIEPVVDTEPTVDAVRLKKAEDEAVALRADLAKMQEARQRDDISKWVTDECPYLNVPATEAVDKIMKALKLDKDLAEDLKKTFKATSDALRDSELFKTFGRDGGDSTENDTIADGYVGQVVKKTEEIKKADSGSVRKASDVVIDAIKSIGGSRYATYRSDHIHRAKIARTV